MEQYFFVGGDCILKNELGLGHSSGRRVSWQKRGQRERQREAKPSQSFPTKIPIGNWWWNFLHIVPSWNLTLHMKFQHWHYTWNFNTFLLFCERRSFLLPALCKQQQTPTSLRFELGVERSVFHKIISAQAHSVMKTSQSLVFIVSCEVFGVYYNG